MTKNNLPTEKMRLTIEFADNGIFKGVPVNEELHNILKVAVRYGITQRSVSTILREAGINLPHHGGLPKAKPEDKDTCFYCRAYSCTEQSREDYEQEMRRWTHSAGCHTEWAVATAIGLSVIFEDFDNRIKFE